MQKAYFTGRQYHMGNNSKYKKKKNSQKLSYGSHFEWPAKTDVWMTDKWIRTALQSIQLIQII